MLRPMDYHGALARCGPSSGSGRMPSSVNEGANTLDLARGVHRHVSAAQAAGRRHLGRHGVIGMGFAIAAAD